MNRRNLMIISGLLLMTALTTGFDFGGWQSQILQGNKNLEAGQVAESIEVYNQALVEEPDQAMIHYNLGHAKYQQDHFAEAKEHFNKAITYSEEEQRELISQSEYNLGNVAYREGTAKVQENPQEAMNLYESALQHYKQAIADDAEDVDARYNYEFVKKKLDELKEQQQEHESEDQNQDQQDQEEQDEEEQDQQDQEQQDEENQDQQDQEQQDEENQDQQDQQQNQQDQSDQQQNQNEQQQQDEQDQQQQQQNEDQQQQQNEEQDQQQNQSSQQKDQQSGEEAQSAAEEAQAGEEQQVGLSKEEALQLLEQFKDQDGEFIPVQPKTYQKTEDFKDW